MIAAPFGQKEKHLKPTHMGRITLLFINHQDLVKGWKIWCLAIMSMLQYVSKFDKFELQLTKSKAFLRY